MSESIPIVVPPSFDLKGAAEKINLEAEKRKKRAERFGTSFSGVVNPFSVDSIDRTEAKRLALQKEPGLVTGVDVFTEEAKSAALLRAERFGTVPFSYANEPAKAAGLSEVEVEIREARRERAARFNKQDELDIAIATAANLALNNAAEAGDDLMEGSTLYHKLHIRAYKYLPASSKDLISYFSSLSMRPSFIEWLNGISANVIFEDAETAKRAFESFAEPIPVVENVPAVDPKWRVCLKPLIKQKTDKYAPAGSETTIYVRFATEADTRDRAGVSLGPRSQGTFSRGLYSKESVQSGEPGKTPAMVASLVTTALKRVAEEVGAPEEGQRWKRRRGAQGDAAPGGDAGALLTAEEEALLAEIDAM
jgi:hypothetical protein